jgi:stage II sporulation protein D (peptidoglycan lytic transglycosylase)
VTAVRRVAVALAVLAVGVHGSGFHVGAARGATIDGTQSANAPSAMSPERATLRVGILRPDGGYTVSAMPIEAYVASVLAGEAMRDSRPAALEALAITIRTYALANRGRHRADGFDLCDQTHCQVVRAATPATERAARATAGRLLVRDGAPATVYYTASCGGRTEIPSEVWPGHDDPPYLPSKDDDACQGAPAWTAEINEGDLLRALHGAGFRGDDLRSMRIVSTNASGRVARLQLDGLRPGQISGQDLRVAVGRTLGWQHIKSTAFDLRKNDGSYRFSGRGSGHGVGLCVIGSARLAERGAGAVAILARYFPGLAISPAQKGVVLGSDPSTTPEPARSHTKAPTDVLISLPDDNEGERATIERQTVRMRDDLARALAVGVPARLTLRFHPTTDDYEKATGRAWFTSGAVVNNEVHLLPLATLRERGVLDRTIRHELVHLMTDSVLGNRPQWVREGAAIYFAGEPPIPGEPLQRPAFKPERAACPSDNELLRPVSVGALANAYARARMCVARQIAAGRSWRDIR